MTNIYVHPGSFNRICTWFSENSHIVHRLLSYNHLGPVIQRSFIMKLSAVMPLVSKSTGFSFVGQYFHLYCPAKSRVSFTRFATNLGSTFCVAIQCNTIWLSDHIVNLLQEMSVNDQPVVHQSGRQSILVSGVSKFCCFHISCIRILAPTETGLSIPKGSWIWDECLNTNLFITLQVIGVGFFANFNVFGRVPA